MAAGGTRNLSLAMLKCPQFAVCDPFPPPTARTRDRIGDDRPTASVPQFVAV